MLCFIMLIFFIVTATFLKQAGIEVVRPDAETDEPKPLVSVLVAISPAGDIWIDKSRVDPAAVPSEYRTNSRGKPERRSRSSSG